LKSSGPASAETVEMLKARIAALTNELEKTKAERSLERRKDQLRAAAASDNGGLSETRKQTGKAN
jgi:hypothetical protein